MNATVLIGSVIESLAPRLFDALSPFVLTEAIAKKYDFKGVPTADQLAAGPANFHYGKVTRATGELIVVEQLLIQYVDVRATSIGATTKSSTADTSFFLDDLLKWLHETFQVNISETYPTYYHSVVEVQFHEGLRRLNFLENVGREIGNLLRSYGFTVPDYQVTGLNLHLDPTSQALPMVQPFSIERRVGARFEENRYFSQAPLKTSDHMDIIRRMEEILSATAFSPLR